MQDAFARFDAIAAKACKHLDVVQRFTVAQVAIQRYSEEAVKLKVGCGLGGFESIMARACFAMAAADIIRGLARQEPAPADDRAIRVEWKPMEPGKFGVGDMLAALKAEGAKRGLLIE